MIFRLVLSSHIALLIVFSQAAEATEFVVNQQDVAASDDNPGSREKPFKTISAAVSRVKAGDKVIVHGGDYREVVIIASSGTAQAPIVIEAAPGETPVIKGSDIITGWEREEGSVWKARLKRFPPRGASGKEPAFWNTNDVRQVFTRDGALLDAQRLGRVTSRGAMRAGTFFCDTSVSVLFVWLADSASPVEHPPEAAVRGAWLCVYGSHVVVRGFAMRHSSTTAIANWPACNVQGDNIALEDCLLSWGDFVGVSLAGKSNRLSRNVIACHGACGAGGTGQNHVIENCRFVYNNVDRYNTQWHAGGAKLIPSFQHGTVRHNEFAHNLGPGLWLDGQCDENVIDGNFSHDNEGPGIMVEISTGNLVSNNICFRNHNSLSGPYRDASGEEKMVYYSEPKVAPSRLLKPYHAGEGRGILVFSAPKTKVLHNTVYLNEAEGICVDGPPRSDGSRTVATRHSVVINNISVFNHGSQLTLLPDTADEEGPSSKSDYNMLFSVGAVLAKYGWEGPAAWSIKEWQKISGQDMHSLDADPQFAMAAMEDFRLLESSAALRAGKALDDVRQDYFGQPRGKEKTSIGACEAPAQTYPIRLIRDPENESAKTSINKLP